MDTAEILQEITHDKKNKLSTILINTGGQILLSIRGYIQFCLIYSQHNPEKMERLDIGKNCALMDFTEHLYIFIQLSFPMNYEYVLVIIYFFPNV